MFHSNHRPISHRFRDKWRFQAKIANFSHPREGVPLGIGYRRKRPKNRMMGLPDGRKSFKIGLAIDTIPVCDNQPASQKVLRYQASRG